MLSSSCSCHVASLLVASCQSIEQLEAELADLRQQVRSDRLHWCGTPWQQQPAGNVRHAGRWLISGHAVPQQRRQQAAWQQLMTLPHAPPACHPQPIHTGCPPASYALTDGGGSGGAGGASSDAAGAPARQPAARLPQVPLAGELTSYTSYTALLPSKPAAWSACHRRGSLGITRTPSSLPPRHAHISPPVWEELLALTDCTFKSPIMTH